MKAVRCVVVAAGTFFLVMTVLSAVLFGRCRCTGKQFSPYVCLIRHWTPGVRRDLPECRENLIRLEVAKFDWAREHSAGEGAKVTWADLTVYLKDGKRPMCRRGGQYHLNHIGEEPDCVGACRLHADPLKHALEPAALCAATDEGNPLSSGRFSAEDWIDRRRRQRR